MAVLWSKEEELARLLFELGAIKFGAFKLKLHQDNPDAPLSPIYLNLRTQRHPVNPGPLTDEAMVLIGDLFSREVVGDYTKFADIPDAGAPFGDQVQRIAAERRPNATRLFLHKEILEDGGRRITDQVDGKFVEGEVCLLVDELITQAGSKLEAIRALENNGLVVNEVLVLVDRMQGGREQLEAAGYKLVSVFKLDDLLALYVKEGSIEQSKADEVLAYVATNRV